jgi:hypothetical protein
LHVVSEQRDVISDLGQVGVLDGVRWSYQAAAARTLDLYSEADGHDSTLLGNLRFTYFRDRLDRVFSCGRYEVGTVDGLPVDPTEVYAELTQDQISSMPHLAPELVTRADLNGSPGWAFGEYRFLLSSSEYGQISTLPWARKSSTKQRVAKQRQVPPGQDSLFAGLADGELAGLEALVAAAFELDMQTFVVAHSLDVVTQDMELVIGRPRHNGAGGSAWHWIEDLLRGRGSGGGRRPVAPSAPSDPDAEPDAPVRLRHSQPKQADTPQGEV